MARLPFFFTTEEIVSAGRTTHENINIIQNWISSLNEDNLPNVQVEMIVIFLLSCDNDIPLTKNTILMFYKCKADYPDIFDNRDLNRKDIKLALNTINISSLPVRTKENYAIHYFSLKDTRYTNFELVPIMKLTYMLLDITQAKNLPNGLVVILDMKGVGLRHLTRMKLSALKPYFQFLQEGLPLQMIIIHIVNAVYFIDKIMNMIKFCVKSELLNKIKIHAPTNNPEKLFNLVPKNCWPADYGGDLPTVAELHQITLEQFKEKQEFWHIEEEIRHKK